MFRYSAILKGIAAGVVLVALMIPLQLSASGYAACKEFIVKTGDAETLQGFAESARLVVGPLVTYPDPSQEVLELFGCYYVVTVPDTVEESMIEALESLPGVEYVEPNLRIALEPIIEVGSDNPFYLSDSFFEPYLPNDSLFSQQYDKRITQTHWAWNVSTGEGVIIAIIDTGIDADHEDLADNLDIGHSYDFFTGKQDVEDEVGHGTFVAGVAGAQMDNHKGIAGIAGDCSIWALKANESGTIVIVMDAKINAILYAADNGAQVINMSFGAFREPHLAEKEAIDYAWGKNLFFCASAGNVSEDASSYYPAAYEHVMGVGSTKNYDMRSGFSNYGPAVSIYAPGSYIWSTTVGDEYAANDGTSFAAPQIAGLAALIWSAHPEWTNLEVADKILESADTITIDKGKVLRMNSRKALDIDIPGVGSQPPESLAIVSALHIQRGGVSFSCRVPGATDYTLKLFNVAGREVVTKSGRLDGGAGEITLNPAFAPGVYLWRIITGYGEEWGKLVWMK